MIIMTGLRSGQVQYVVLEEGTLRCYTSYEKHILMEEIVLTRHRVKVEMIRDGNDVPNRFQVSTREISSDGDKLHISSTTQTIMFATTTRTERVAWCNRIHNWNRYVFHATPKTVEIACIELNKFMNYMKQQRIKSTKIKTLPKHRYSPTAYDDSMESGVRKSCHTSSTGVGSWGRIRSVFSTVSS